MKAKWQSITIKSSTKRKKMYLIYIYGEILCNKYVDLRICMYVFKDVGQGTPLKITEFADTTLVIIGYNWHNGSKVDEFKRVSI